MTQGRIMYAPFQLRRRTHLTEVHHAYSVLNVYPLSFLSPTGAPHFNLAIGSGSSCYWGDEADDGSRLDTPGNARLRLTDSLAEIYRQTSRRVFRLNSGKDRQNLRRTYHDV